MWCYCVLGLFHQAHALLLFVEFPLSMFYYVFETRLFENKKFKKNTRKHIFTKYIYIHIHLNTNRKNFNRNIQNLNKISFLSFPITCMNHILAWVCLLPLLFYFRSCEIRARNSKHLYGLSSLLWKIFAQSPFIHSRR